MTGINRMTGAPWHVERMGRKEDDPRRHRSRCKFYNKKNRYCSYRYGYCIGAAHCTDYFEKVNDQTVAQTNDTNLVSKVCEFEGVKNIPMADIKIGKKFKSRHPKEKKSIS